MSTQKLKLAILWPGEQKTGASTVNGKAKLFLTALVAAAIFQGQNKSPKLTASSLKTQDEKDGAELVVVTDESHPFEISAIIDWLKTSGAASTYQSAVGLVAGKCNIQAANFQKVKIAQVLQYIESIPVDVQLTVETMTDFFKAVPFVNIASIEDAGFAEVVQKAKEQFAWDALNQGKVTTSETGEVTFVETAYPVEKQMITTALVEKYLTEKKITTDVVILAQERYLATTDKKEMSAVTVTNGYDVKESQIASLCGLKKTGMTGTLTTSEKAYVNFFSGDIEAGCRKDPGKVFTNFAVAIKNSSFEKATA